MTTATAEPTLYELPREGYALFYKEDGHAYQRVNPKGKPGKRWTSVTTICNAHPDRPDGLMRWVEKLTLEGVARLASAEVGMPTDPHVLRYELEQHGLRWEQIRDAKGKIGKDIHLDVLEALAAGRDIPDLADLPAEQRGYGQAMLKWWLDRDPQPLSVEQIVLSLDHEYAGRLDLRAGVSGLLRDDPVDGETWLVDIKTGKHIMPKFHIQAEGYELAADECGVGETDRRMIVHLKPDGTYNEIESVATAADFLRALASHRGKLDLDRRIRSAA